MCSGAKRKSFLVLNKKENSEPFCSRTKRKIVNMIVSRLCFKKKLSARKVGKRSTKLDLFQRSLPVWFFFQFFFSSFFLIWFFQFFFSLGLKCGVLLRKNFLSSRLPKTASKRIVFRFLFVSYLMEYRTN